MSACYFFLSLAYFMRSSYYHSCLRLHSVFALDLSDLIPPPFISFARLLLAPPPEWEKAREKGKPPKPKMDKVTRAVVREVLERRVRMYPGSIEVSASYIFQRRRKC